MAPHSSTLAWKIPWLEGPGRLQSMGSLGVLPTEWLHFHFSLSCIGEGNGKPPQCSCLENPRDGGAWWAAVSMHMWMCLVTCTDNLKPKIYMHYRWSPSHNWFDLKCFDFIVVWKRYALVNMWSALVMLVGSSSFSFPSATQLWGSTAHIESLEPAAILFFSLSTLFNKWHGLPGGASLPANAGDIRDVGSSPGLRRFPWKEEMATCSSILAWRLPWILVGHSPWGCKESGMTEVS